MTTTCDAPIDLGAKVSVTRPDKYPRPTKPSVSAVMVAAPDEVVDACIDAVSTAEVAFSPEFSDCEEHGPYQISFWNKQKNRAEWRADHCPRCHREKILSTLFDSADIDEILKGESFATYRADNDGQKFVLGASQDYVRDWTGDIRTGSTSRLLFGNSGTGKNHLIASIARELMPRGITVRCVQARSLVERIWSLDFSERERFLKQVSQVGLFVIDELDKGFKTAEARNELFRVIDIRNKAARPTFVVGNGEKEALIEILGTAAYDRLRHKGGKIWPFFWGSSR